MKSPTTTDEGYYIDIVSDNPRMPAPMVQTHIRHLMLAIELGDLVIVECMRTNDDVTGYIICASVVGADNKRALLPICELPNTADLLEGFRPPRAAQNRFVKPTHTGHYEVCTLHDPEEVALAEVAGKGAH